MIPHGSSRDKTQELRGNQLKPKVLVANRGEIACRVFQACREMGLKSVGVFTADDEEARHVTYADESYSVSSYLDVAAILNVCQKAKVQLVHPGYGFLSERPNFVSTLEMAGFVFVGPQAKTMELMGGKMAAKELAASQKVPTLPWAKISRGGDLKGASKKVGFPLLLKAHAGGGGKGMRYVCNLQELDAAAESASAEAMAAFGDGTLFLERYVDAPRHIEVQIFGDGRGKGLHYWERECSLQRRHQKILEEAQAPNLSHASREKLYKSALKLVKAVQYRSAGTVEFLLDEDENFYFLEMNTRLQVEHPVTECITGIDLVHTQLTQALNSKFSLPRESPTARGHAIEVRIYAEDPAQGFIPTPGKIEKLRWPSGPGIRVDSGIEEGQTIGIQFDSLLAKLIVFAETREKALARLQYALQETVILGCGTNVNYLLALLDDAHVRSGKVSTQYLERGFKNNFKEPSTELLELIGAAHSQQLGLLFSTQVARGGDQSQMPSPWTHFSKRRPA